MCFISIKLFIVRTIYVCHSFQLIQRHNSNYNNNCLFDILLCLQSFCKQQHLFVRHETRLYTKLTELLLPVVWFVLLFYSPTQTVWLTFLKQNVLFEAGGSRSRLLQNSIATACICAFSYFFVPCFPHACCYWFTFIGFDVFVSGYL